MNTSTMQRSPRKIEDRRILDRGRWKRLEAPEVTAARRWLFAAEPASNQVERPIKVRILG